MTFMYDEEGDVLYAFAGKPIESTYDPVGRGIYLRRDSKSGKPIGFMILNYAKRFDTKKTPRIPYFESIGIPPLKEIAL